MATSWQAISAAMERAPAVFIAGVPRSGTSALRRTLARLPAFAARGAEGPETWVFVHPERVFRVLEADGERLLRFFLGDAERARALLEAARSLERPGALRGLLARLAAGRGGARGRARAWRLLGRHHLVRLFFHFAKQARGVSRVLEKTPAHLERLPELQATFPHARVILCVRHPVEVLSSHRKRLLKEERKGHEQEALWLRASTEEFCVSYAEQVALAALAARERPDAVALVRYEDLTAAPGPALERLCSFLAEPFDQKALLDDVAERRDKFGSPGPGGRIVPNEKEWREFLEEEEARRIEARLAAVMETLSYRPLAS